MVIGLTGGIASGKSLVAGELERLGALVIDADLIARDVLHKGEKAYLGVVGEFGTSILLPDGSIDRKRLGDEVFSDKERLRRLGEITHPWIIREIERLVLEMKTQRPDALIVIDAPLLMETGLQREVDRVVVVSVDKETSIERLVKKTGMSRDEAKRRVESQMPIEEKVRRADHVIDNSGRPEDAVAETRRLYERLVEEARRAE